MSYACGTGIAPNLATGISEPPPGQRVSSPAAYLFETTSQCDRPALRSRRWVEISGDLQTV